jgi:hypothetical protein
VDTCSICPRALPPAFTDAFACVACLHRMRYVLAELQHELPLLQAALVPGGTGPRIGSRFGGRAHSPMPLNGQALDLLGPGLAEQLPDPYDEQVAGVPVLPLLRSLADRLAADFPARHIRYGTEYVQPYGGATAAANRGGAGIAAWCRWLTTYLPYAMHLYWVAELHQALEDVLVRVRAVTRTQPSTHPRHAPCPDCGACAMSRTDGRWEITCEACGCQMEPDAYDAHAAAVLPGLARTMARIVAANAQLNQAS